MQLPQPPADDQWTYWTDFLRHYAVIMLLFLLFNWVVVVVLDDF